MISLVRKELFFFPLLILFSDFVLVTDGSSLGDFLYSSSIGQISD